MARSFRPGVYKDLLSVRAAWLFDIGGLLMRMYSYMIVLGTITMLTLLGYDYTAAGSVASVAAIALFALGPQISRLVDSFGQARIVPLASAVAIVGMIILLANAALSGPIWVSYLAAVLIGATPSAQSLTRARWTYLLKSGRLGTDAPELKTIYSYEGLLDDASYMVGPSLSIALASIVHPLAGMAAGTVMLGVGAALLSSARSSDPGLARRQADGADSEFGKDQTDETSADYAPQDESSQERGISVTRSVKRLDDPKAESQSEVPRQVQTCETAQASGKDATKPQRRAKGKSVFITSGLVRALFFIMLLEGVLYGIYDTALVSFGNATDQTSLVSGVLMATAVASIISGAIFGMVRIPLSRLGMLLATCTFLGLAYGSMVFIHSAPSLVLVATLASVSYAPFTITVNETCQSGVPGRNLTEALTWINSGLTLGMAAGPTIGGMVADTWGTFATFTAGAIVAIAIPVLAFALLPILRKLIGRHA